MSWAYKLFWSSVVTVAVVGGLSACSQPKTEKKVRLNPGVAAAPGTQVTRPSGTVTPQGTNSTATSPINTTIITSEEGFKITIKKPDVSDINNAVDDDEFFFNYAVNITTNFPVGTTDLNIYAYQYKTELYSNALPALNGGWTGGFASKCSDDKCTNYYMVIYLVNPQGSQWRMIGLKYLADADEPAVVTYPVNRFLAWDQVFAALDNAGNTN